MNIHLRLSLKDTELGLLTIEMLGENAISMLLPVPPRKFISNC